MQKQQWTKGRAFPFGSMVVYHLISANDQSRLHPFGMKVLPGTFGSVLIAVEFGKEILWSQWSCKHLDASEIDARRLAKKIIRPKNCEHFIFPIAEGTSELSGGDHGTGKSTSMRDQPVRGEELGGDLRGSSDGSQPTDATIDDREARNDFWSIEGT